MSGRVLALDYGSARCGAAITDPTGTIARPLETVPRPDTRRGMGRLLGLVSEHGVETVIVGLPVTLAGGESAQTAEARAFAERLRGRLPAGVALELFDERFTTRLALRDPDPRAAEDARAAAHLLEGWLARRAAAR